MYQDTYIEYWGEIFVSARIIEFGITFERFLKDPWKHLMSCGQSLLQTRLLNSRLNNSGFTISENIDDRLDVNVLCFGEEFVGFWLIM